MGGFDFIEFAVDAPLDAQVESIRICTLLNLRPQKLKQVSHRAVSIEMHALLARLKGIWPALQL